jgi:carboxyl-terminal processing protease
MMPFVAVLVGLGTLLVTEPAPPRVFEQVVPIVERRLEALQLDGERFPRLVESYRPLILSAPAGAQEHAMINRMLGELKVSHLALLEGETYAHLERELKGESVPTLGLQLTLLRGHYFVSALAAGGPAERAGLGLGDRIVSLDGIPLAESTRLIPGGGDPGLGGPPTFFPLARRNENVALEVQTGPDAETRVEVVLTPESMSGLTAVKRSARVRTVRGHRIAFVQLPFMAPLSLPTVLRDLLQGDLADAEGLVLDLRGRGGYEKVAREILALFAPSGRNRKPVWQKPVVALIDRRSRSAKEVLSYYLKRYGAATLVGEPTEGAVLGAGFERMRDGSVLMVPVQRVSVNGGVDLEGVGVSPDYEVDQPLEFAHGVDHILARGVQVLLARIAARQGARLVASLDPLGLGSGPKREVATHGGRGGEERGLAHGAIEAQLPGPRRDVTEHEQAGAVLVAGDRDALARDLDAGVVAASGLRDLDPQRGGGAQAQRIDASGAAGSHLDLAALGDVRHGEKLDQIAARGDPAQLPVAGGAGERGARR